MNRHLSILLLLLCLNTGNLLGNTVEQNTIETNTIEENTIEENTIAQICPPNWWTGMKNPKLQILVYGDNIGKSQVSLSKYSGVSLEKVEKVENPNYLFLNLNIQEAQAGTLKFKFKPQEGKSFEQNYELKARNIQKNTTRGLETSDFIYLIMPDRFSNGNPDNDAIEKMEEKKVNRTEMFDRHGGDLQGIINHLDYLEELGINALWLNPIVENNQPDASYHGYAATNHYKIDPRFGDMDTYLDLVTKCHEKGIKIVRDVIHNHIGNEHFLFKDLPEKDWVHEWDGFTRTTYRAPTLFDPYGSNYDKKQMVEGWFDNHMPDLNQDNEKLRNYIIQNDLWWIEYGGVDIFRMDTYAYSDPNFLEKWDKAIFTEYPQMGVFAETWVHGVPTQAYFHGKTQLNKDFNNRMPSLTDFQMHYALNETLTGKFGWTEGVSKLYYTLAKDYIYDDPSKNILFLDNHDLSRFYSVVGEDFDLYKMGISLLVSTRGIPCMYYGTEILMKNFADPDGKVREDFPGGWTEDKTNKFTKEGRTDQENEAFEFVKKLIQYRKNNPVLQDGKLMQFIPNEGTYTFFRYNQNKTLMIVVNTNDKAFDLDCGPFAERIQGSKTGTDIVTGETYDVRGKINVPKTSTLILELK